MDKPNVENDYQECYSAALRIAEKELKEEDKEWESKILKEMK